MTLVVLPVPHIQQQQESDCVAACAAMALDYLGVSVAYSRLLKLLRVKDIGTAAPNIRELEKLGVVVIYKQGTLEELHDHLINDRPCIAFVKTVELPYWEGVARDHAVVVVGLDEQHVYLNDPAFPNAPMRVSLGDFDLAWLGRDEFYAALKRRG
jgi:ABC-type bacteriocin/lantibiotic exporter with double-glycine peptidase domain